MAERRLLHRPQARWDLPGGPLFPCDRRVSAERGLPLRLQYKPHPGCSGEPPLSCLRRSIERVLQERCSGEPQSSTGIA